MVIQSVLTPAILSNRAEVMPAVNYIQKCLGSSERRYWFQIRPTGVSAGSEGVQNDPSEVTSKNGGFEVISEACIAILA